MPRAVGQVEVVVAGPNIGECCLVNLGEDRWIVIDSCRNSKTRRPFALDYFYEANVDPAHVCWVIATHWHDDHIDGMQEVLSACPNANFAMSMAFTHDEFLDYAAIMASQHAVAGGSGTTELMAVLEYMRAAGRTIKRASADRRLETFVSVGESRSCEIWSLSPSDVQCEKFLAEIIKYTPVEGADQFVARPQSPNNVSTVVLVTFDDTAILFGADLEEVAAEHEGWQAIVNSTGRPTVKAAVFKVPHHGAPNGYHKDVWNTLLQSNPIAVVTPYAGGRTKRPSDSDIAVLRGHTDELYLTRRPGRRQRIRPRDRIVDKTIKESGVKLHLLDLHSGYVRMRNGGLSNFHSWTIELFGDAEKIADAVP